MNVYIKSQEFVFLFVVSIKTGQQNLMGFAGVSLMVVHNQRRKDGKEFALPDPYDCTISLKVIAVVAVKIFSENMEVLRLL